MPAPTACASPSVMVTPLVAAAAAAPASSGMARGVPPVPRESGDTLSDWRAEMVHASMSIVPEAEWECCWGLTAAGAVVAAACAAGWACAGGGDSGGGGTALYFPIAMVARLALEHENELASGDDGRVDYG